MQTQQSNPGSHRFYSTGAISRIWGGALLATIIAMNQFIFPVAALTSGRAPSATAMTMGSSFACSYVVRPGDDLFQIGLRHGVSWWVLAVVNGLPNPHMIYVGMVLRVPCLVAPPVTPPPAPSICSTYIVQRGEWLGLIADHYHVSWQAVAAANLLSNPNLIFPGQGLLIPCGPDTTSKGTVLDELNNVEGQLSTSGELANLTARLKEIGLLGADRQNVMDLMNRDQVKGWTGDGAICSPDNTSPYQVMAAPVISEEAAMTGTRRLIGVLVLPRCTVVGIPAKGFTLESSSSPTIYALIIDSLVAPNQVSTPTPGIKQSTPSAFHVVTPTPGLMPYTQMPKLVLLRPDGRSQLTLKGRIGWIVQAPPGGTPQPTPQPYISLGSICWGFDGILFCFP